VIFLDTGFLFAYVSADDKDHVRVSEILEAHRGERLSDFLLTTNHVVAETVTLVSKRGHRDPAVRHELAVKVGRQLYAGAFGQVYRIVDCLSFVVMDKRGIREAWAVDADFTHRFTAHPGPAAQPQASARRT
jgi:predicted nucleic acid-binding protein